MCTQSSWPAYSSRPASCQQSIQPSTAASATVHSNLAKKCIADLPPVMDANGLVRSWPHLIHGSLSPTDSTVQTAPPLVQPFCTGHKTWPTDRQTDTQTTRCSICSMTDLVKVLRFTSHSTQIRSFRRRSSQTISWLCSEETEPNTTNASNTRKW